MPKAGLGQVSKSFSGATKAKQTHEEVHQLESEVERLKQEIETLREQGKEDTEAQLTELRQQLSQGGVVDVPLDQIERNPDQPRQTFSEESIAGMALSLKLEGQQEPIILIARPEGGFFIFDGERRWRGAQRNDWETIQSVIIPEPEELHRRVLLANLHREELNALDIAEAVIQEIQRVHEFEPATIQKTLNTAVKRLERKKMVSQVTAIVIAPPDEQKAVLEGLELSETEHAIFSTLLGLQLNPSSVNANIFPMLSIQDDLKQSIREQGLGGLHALALNRITASKLDVTNATARKRRAKLLKEVLDNKLSVAQVRKHVKTALTDKSQSAVSESKKAIATITNNLQRLPNLLDDLNPDELAELKNLVDLLADQVSARLPENN
ncbi:ParB-like partition protein [Leptolyngbya sp. PCC 7375]|nr:ParB-like partition protein [Leptolyngbya sp. PCC 7375]